MITSLMDHAMRANPSGSLPYGAPKGDGKDRITAFNGETAAGEVFDTNCLQGAIRLIPAPGKAPMTNNRGCRDADRVPVDGYASYDDHPGYDYRATDGTPVKAAAGGKVLDGPGCILGNMGGSCAAWGMIGIDHGNGYVSQYSHMRGLKVAPGQTVTAGQVIGLASNTAPAGTNLGAHLHFEVLKRVGNQWLLVDPYGWTGGGSDPLFTAARAPPARLWAGGPATGTAASTDPRTPGTDPALHPGEPARVDPSLIPVSVGGRCGFAGLDGRMAIAAQFDKAGWFGRVSGLAPVSVDGRWGLINRTGAFAVRPQFDYLFPTGDGDQFVVKTGALWGTVNGRGAPVIRPQFESIGPFDAQGRAAAKVNGKEGVIDRAGRFLIPPRFDAVEREYLYERQTVYFAEGRAIARIGGLLGFINENGDWVIPPQFLGASRFSPNGLAVVQARVPSAPTGMAFGYVNRAGRFAIPPRYEWAQSFVDAGLAPVKFNGLWGYIDKTGSFRIRPQFLMAYPFFETPGGTVAVMEASADGDPLNRRFGVIDERGSTMIAPTLPNLIQFDRNGRAVQFRDRQFQAGTKGLIDPSGRFVVPPVFNSVGLLPGMTDYFFHRGGEVGFIDKDANILMSFRGEPCVGPQNYH